MLDIIKQATETAMKVYVREALRKRGDTTKTVIVVKLRHMVAIRSNGPSRY